MPSPLTIEPLAHHVMLRLDDGRTLARTPEQRRSVAATIQAQGARRGLLVFRLADTHLHALLATDRLGAAAFANYAATSLRWRLPLSKFDHARIRPVADQSHLQSAFRYILRQEQHHGISLDPTHEGSSVPDLVGLRVPARDPWRALKPLLPRISRAHVLEMLGWGMLDRWPLRFDALADSVAACGAQLPLARCAAAHLAHPTLGTRALAQALGVHRRSVLRWLQLEAPPAHLRALELQLRLRTALAPTRGDVDPDAAGACHGHDAA